MKASFEQQWYRPSLTVLTFCLLPLSWLFRAGTAVRRFIYRSKLKKSYRFSQPVIIVGNITVGGTGKTPFVIALVEILRKKGYFPGIVTRGVSGRKYVTPQWVTEKSSVVEVGDEAILLAKRTPCPLVICIDRVAAVQELLAKTTCNIVISDDGLQHYRLERDIEIAMLDGVRRLGNQQLIPCGPLREPVSRLKTVDFIVSQGVALQDEYSMQLVGDFVVSLKDKSQKIPIDTFKQKRVHAVAAIGHPQRFFTMLREKGFDVIEHAFPDHYFFKQKDLHFSDSLPVLMTEKDAVKCQQFAEDRFWVVPVEAQLDKELIAKLFQRLSEIQAKQEVKKTCKN